MYNFSVCGRAKNTQLPNKWVIRVIQNYSLEQTCLHLTHVYVLHIYIRCVNIKRLILTSKAHYQFMESRF